MFVGFTLKQPSNNHDLQDCHGPPLPWPCHGRSKAGSTRRGPAGPATFVAQYQTIDLDEHARIRKLEQHFNDEEQTTNPE